jgi:hypothetical protein
MADDDAKPTDGTVADLKDHIADIKDPDHLEQLRAEEQAGKNRAGALTAIDDRKAELIANGDSVTEHNVTSTAGDSDANATHDEGGALATDLVQAPHPETLTDDEINAASGDGLKDGASQPQRDVAEALVADREAAQADPDFEGLKHLREARTNPLYGYGPGADIG